MSIAAWCRSRKPTVSIPYFLPGVAPRLLRVGKVLESLHRSRDEMEQGLPRDGRDADRLIAVQEREHDLRVPPDVILEPERDIEGPDVVSGGEEQFDGDEAVGQFDAASAVFDA